MPDTKFSLAALREHIRKFLWIYLIGIAVCLVGTSLLWTTTRPRPSNDQLVSVYMAGGFSNPEALQDVADDMLERTGPFDENLRAVEFQSLLFNDSEYSSAMVLLARLSAGECDAFLADQAAMDSLVTSQVLVPLDEPVAQGWLGDYGLEPYYAQIEDDETGKTETLLAGLRLDPVTALGERGAFLNDGAYLCVIGNGGNVETTMKALEFMMEDLMEASHAQTEAAEPAA